jgi:hypothetical protein
MIQGTIYFTVLLLLTICIRSTPVSANSANQIVTVADIVGYTNERIAKTSANWAESYLSVVYGVPLGARFVLLSGRNDTECDLTRISYTVNGINVIVSETSCVLAVRISKRKIKETDDADLLTIAEINTLAKEVFKNSENLELLETKVDKRYSGGKAKTAGGAMIKEEPKLMLRSPKIVSRLDSLNWEQTPDYVLFHTIKRTEGLSASIKSYDFFDNFNWFDQRKNDLDIFSKNFPERKVIDQLNNVSLTQENVVLITKDSERVRQILSNEFQPPITLLPIIVSLKDTTSTRLSFQVDQSGITIAQTANTFVVKVEDVSPKPVLIGEQEKETTPNKLMTPPKVGVLSQKLFRNVADFVVTTELYNDEQAFGSISLTYGEQGEKNLVPNTIKWWQDTKQVLFFFPKKQE